jgi:Protein of unknown function (DUF4238)
VSLDHYVSQVHLRKFYAEALDSRKMFAYRKSDGKQFICGSKDVCRIEEGSTNQFLTEPRILEEFLRKVEPNYDGACDAISREQFNTEDLFVLAGFAAFVIGTSPTAMRLGADTLTHLAHSEVELMDRMGKLDRAPEALGNKTATELIHEGSLRIETDSKYPQAMGISGIVGLTQAFSTFHWEILLNPKAGRFPFVTSDYPAAVEGLGRQVPATRIIPLRPDLALRIMPQIRPKGRPDLESDFRFKLTRATPTHVRSVNMAIVRSAENLVFSSINAPWIQTLVTKNKRYRLELENTRAQKGSGFLHLNSVIVREAASET